MKTIITACLLSTAISANAQLSTVDIYESTLKVPAFGEEVYYCGFAEGDQCIFSFEEVKGKELKEFELIEMPSTSKFMDYKTSKIENKTINITKTGIYKFRLSNSSIAGRICKLKIQRIPANNTTKNFNTSVYWKTIFDTTYTTEEEKYLIKSDTSISNLTDQVAKVHSGGNPNGNKTTFNFTLPDNTIAWSYYLGVDQAGQEIFESATKELSSKAAPLLTKIPGYGPMAALALGGISYLTQLQSGEDIDFYIVDNNNVNLFSTGQQFSYFKKGKVINDYSKMTAPLKGMYHVCLANDNAVTGVQVTIKITAIIVTQQWGNRPVKRMHVATRQEPYLK
jgi:hypothetical protein